jgi:hypothetical protein
LIFEQCSFGTTSDIFTVPLLVGLVVVLDTELFSKFKQEVPILSFTDLSLAIFLGKNG